ncbi:hypothetical protein IAD21_05225 [Abditibacteriota bacterium]|nr:hypothetical protein IAD21_05225 [Abditibacteriota bacterium]
MKHAEQAPSPTLEERLDAAKTRADRLKRGESFEKTAFGLCKIALFCLLTGPFTLPLAAIGAAFFFIMAVWHGKRDTKCWAKNPIGIATFWLIVAAIWTFLHLR